MSQALLVIDLQNDYFPGGKFPLWNTNVVLQNIERAIEKANAHSVPVIHIQHVAKGVAPFFNEGTPGADIHPRILAAAPNAPFGFVFVMAFRGKVRDSGMIVAELHQQSPRLTR